MILDILKNIAEQTLKMDWQYGTKSSHNLCAPSADKYTMLVLPLVNKPQLNSFNKVTENNWEIALFMCITADMDGGTPGQNGSDYYAEKCDKSIKPLYDDNAVGKLTAAFTCKEELTLSGLNVTEVINLFDENVDGLYITFNIREDLI